MSQDSLKRLKESVKKEIYDELSNAVKTPILDWLPRHNHDKVNSAKISASASGGNFYTEMKTRTTGDGAGDVVITTDFEPKLIKILAIADIPGGWSGWSQGSVSAAGGQCIGYSHAGSAWEKLYSTTYILYVFNDGESSRSRATITEISSTGFTLNFDKVEVNVRYIVEAFG